MKVDLRDIAGAKVVSLALVRKHVEDRVRKDACTHLSIEIDPLLTHVHCTECGKDVNAVEWIATLVEHWECVERIGSRLKEQREELDMLADALELQRRARCQHCGEMTRVRLPSRAESARRLIHHQQQGDGK